MTRMKKPTAISLVLLAQLSFSPLNAQTGNPFIFPYSGRITEANGRPIKGPVSMGVSFYSVETGGSALGTGSQTFANVPLKQGVFQLQINLSDSDYRTVFAHFTDAIWVEITDLTNNKVYPRQRLTMAPYAGVVPVDDAIVRYDGDGKLTVAPFSTKGTGQFVSRDNTGLIWSDAPAPGTQLAGHAISATAPTAGQILQYDGSQWIGAFVTTGTVSTITASAPLSVTTGPSPTLSLPAASGTSAGYVTSADWLTFNNKQPALGYVPLNKAGDTATGTLNLGGSKITGVPTPTSGTDLANKATADAVMNNLVKQDGSVPLTASWSIGSHDINSVKNLGAATTTTAGQIAVRIDPYGSAAHQVGELRFYELSTSELNYVGFRAPDVVATNLVWTLPALTGAAGYVLQTNGSGQLVWVNLSAAANSISSVSGKTGAVSLDTDDVDEGATNLYSTAARVRAAAVGDAITDGVTDHAPSQNAVHDALALKVAKSGSTMSGSLDLGSHDLINAGQLSAASVTTTTQAGVTVEPSSASAGGTGEIHFNELSANGNNYVGFKAPDSISSSQVWTLPAADGSSNQFLKTDGAGQIGWMGAASTSVADSLADGVTNIAPSENAVSDALDLKLNNSGGTLSGPLAMGANRVTNVTTPTAGSDAANKSYVDSSLTPYLKKDGSSSLTGAWNTGGFNITGLGSFSAGAATLSQVTTSAQNAATLAPYGSSSGETAELRFKSLSGTTAVGFKAADTMASDSVWTLPAGDGTTGQMLRTDGSKNLGFMSPSTGSVADSLTDGVTTIAPSQNAVFDALALKFDTAGGTLTGPLDMSSNRISNAGAPSAGDDAATKLYADTTAATLIRKDGTSPLTANWAAGGFNVSGVNAFSAGASAVTSITTSDQNAVILAPYGATAGQTGEMQFKEISVVRGNSINLKAPDAVAASKVWTLPAADGTAGQVLKTDGSGHLAWTSLSSLTVQDALNDGVTTLAPSQNAVFDALATKVDLTGSTLSGPLDMASHKITGVAAPSAAGDAVNKTYADSVFAPYLKRDGSVPLTAHWATGGVAVTGVSNLTANDATVSSLSTTGQAAVTLAPYATGAGNTGEMRFKELSVVTNRYVGFKAPDTIAANRIWTLPAADGASNQFLITDGSGNLGWSSAAATSAVADVITDNVTTVAPSENAVFDALATKVNLTGGTVTGAIDMTTHKITNVAVPTAAGDLATMAYADGVVAPLVKKDGTVPFTADWNAGGFAISGVNAFSSGAITTATVSTSAQSALAIGPYAAPAGSTGELRLNELTANGSNFIGFKAPDTIASNKIWTLPAADGSANYVLATNGAGVLTFANPSSLVVGDALVDGVTATAPSQNVVYDNLVLKLNKSGGTMTGGINLGANPITSLATPTAGTDAANKSYVDTAYGNYVRKDATSAMTANWAVGNFSITGMNTFAVTGAITAGTVATSLQGGLDLAPAAATAGNTAQIHFMELAAGGTDYVSLKAPDSIAANRIWTLPAVVGATDSVLTTNGSGVLSWADMRANSVADVVTDGVTNIAPSQNAVFDSLALKLNLSGGTMSGALNMGGSKITNLADPVAANDAATKTYGDTQLLLDVKRDGSVPLTSAWAVGNQNITGVGTFTAGASTVTTLATTAQNAVVIAPYSTGAGATGEMRFKALTGSNYVALKAPDTIAASTTLTLPAADGSANYVLKTDGSGHLAWVDLSSLSVEDAINSGTTTLAPSENAVFDNLALKVAKASPSMTGTLNMGSNAITGLATPTAAADAATKAYVDSPVSGWVKTNGTVTMTSGWNVGNALSSVGTLTTTGAASVTSLTSTGAVSATGYTSNNQAGLTLKSTGTVTGEAHFMERAAMGTNYTGFKAPSTIASNKIWTLPAADGTSGYVLKTDGAGNLGWASLPSLVLEDAVTSGKTTFAPTENAAYATVNGLVNRAGDTMTGTLNLPSNGLTVGAATTGVTVAGGALNIQNNSGSSIPLAISTSTLGEKISLAGNNGSDDWGFGVQSDLLDIHVSGTAPNAGFAFGYGTSASFTTLARLHRDGWFLIGGGNPTSWSAPLQIQQAVTNGTEASLITLDSNYGNTSAGPTLDFKTAGAGYLAGIATLDNGAADGDMFFRTSNDAGVTSSQLTASSNKVALFKAGDLAISKGVTSGQGSRLELKKALADGSEEGLLVLDSDTTTTGYGGSIQFRGSGSGYSASIAGVSNGNDGRLEFRTQGNNTMTSSPLTAADTKMSISKSGFVGIGAKATSTATVPIDFGSMAYSTPNATTMPRLSLWNNGGQFYGFGISTNMLMIVEPANSFIDFGYGQSSGMSGIIRIRNATNPGIGVGTMANGYGDVAAGIHVRGGGIHANGISVGTCPSAACSNNAYETIQLPSNFNFRIWNGATQVFYFGNDGSAQKAGSTAWETLSDIRTKNVHGQWQLGLDEILKLQPIVYQYKKDNPQHLNSEQEYVGFSAQDLQKVIPQAVKEGDDGYLRVTADPIIWTMFNGIKDEYHQRTKQDAEQLSTLAGKQDEIAALRDQLSARENRLEQAEATLDQLKAKLCRDYPGACPEP